MWLHTVAVWLTGPDIFLVRLYEVVLGFICITSFHNILKQLYPHIKPWVLLTLPFLLLFDQVFYESLRSVRMEIISCTLLVVFLDAFIAQRRFALQAFCLALLALTHPSIWSVVLVGGILLLSRFKTVPASSGIWAIVLFILPFPAFLWMINWDIAALSQQLFQHGHDHSGAAIGGNFFINHFWLRFCDYTHGTYHFGSYFQPFHPLLNMVCLGFAMYDIIRLKKTDPIPLFIIAINLYWLFALAPFKRYLPPLLVLNYLYLPRIAAAISSTAFLRKSSKWIYGIALLAAGAYFAGINTLAILQRPYRDPYAAQRWIEQYIPGSPGKKYCWPVKPSAITLLPIPMWIFMPRAYRI